MIMHKTFIERRKVMKNKKNKNKIGRSIIIILFLLGSTAWYFIVENNWNGRIAKASEQLSTKAKAVNVNSFIEGRIPGAIYDKEGEEKIYINGDRKVTYEGPLKGNDRSIPILMYHSVEYVKSQPNNNLRVPKEKFREQMKFLKDNGYTTLSMSELYAFFKDNLQVPEKSVVLTFDDGYEDNYNNAFSVLKEFGLKATVFVVTDWVETNNSYMTVLQLKDMDANGFEVQCHTLAHKELNKLTYERQLKDLKESKEFLERNLNKKITTICYPLGKFNKNTAKAAEDAGYLMGMKMVGGWANKNNGMYTINRVYVSAKDTIKQFEAKIGKR